MTPDQHRQTAEALAHDTIRRTTPIYVAGYLTTAGADVDEPGVLTTDTDTITALLHTATVTLTWPTRTDFIRDFEAVLAEPAPATERIPTQAELLAAATPPEHRPVPTRAERIADARADGRQLDTTDYLASSHALSPDTARKTLADMYVVRDQLAAELAQAREKLNVALTETARVEAERDRAWHTAAMAALDNTNPRPTHRLDRIRRQVLTALNRNDDDTTTVDLVTALIADRDQAHADLADARRDLDTAHEVARSNKQHVAYLTAEFERVEAERDQLRDATDGLALTLAEILGHFHPFGGPDSHYYVPDWIPGATRARWRKALTDAEQPTAPAPGSATRAQEPDNICAEPTCGTAVPDEPGNRCDIPAYPAVGCEQLYCGDHLYAVTDGALCRIDYDPRYLAGGDR